MRNVILYSPNNPMSFYGRSLLPLFQQYGVNTSSIRLKKIIDSLGNDSHFLRIDDKGFITIGFRRDEQGIIIKTPERYIKKLKDVIKKGFSPTFVNINPYDYELINVEELFDHDNIFESLIEMSLRWPLPGEEFNDYEKAIDFRNTILYYDDGPMYEIWDEASDVLSSLGITWSSGEKLGNESENFILLNKDFFNNKNENALNVGSDLKVTFCGGLSLISSPSCKEYFEQSYPDNQSINIIHLIEDQKSIQKFFFESLIEEVVKKVVLTKTNYQSACFL